MRPAEQLLHELGISEPRDIEVAAIAHCVGVEIQYRPLVGCEAQIIGFRNKAIVYVSDEPRPRRKRFSASHELGHWHHHRGQSFVCRPEDIGQPIDEKSKNAERLADAYAADLILPPFMIAPMLDQLGEISLAGIIELAGRFSASLTATAIRVTRMTRQPLVLVVHNLLGKRWQWPSISAMGLWVRDDVDDRSTAFTSLVSTDKPGPARKEPANYWFDRRHIEQFDVRAQTVRTIDGEVLTLLRVLDPKMVEIYG